MVPVLSRPASPDEVYRGLTGAEDGPHRNVDPSVHIRLIYDYES